MAANWQNSDLQYAKSKLKKYYKLLDRLVIENDILYHKFFGDDGTVKHKQLYKQKFWKELLYCIHNSKTAGHSGNARTGQKFRKLFYFPGFTEYLIKTIKNCLTCLQPKRAKKTTSTSKLTTCIIGAVFYRRHEAN